MEVCSDELHSSHSNDKKYKEYKKATRHAGFFFFIFAKAEQLYKRTKGKI